MTFTSFYIAILINRNWYLNALEQISIRTNALEQIISIPLSDWTLWYKLSSSQASPLDLRTPLHRHLFCHPSSYRSPSRLLNVLAPKYPQGEAGQFFNTLPPHKDPASVIDRVVTIETGSFLFTLTYPLFIIVILGWLPTIYRSGLPVQVGPFLSLSVSFVLFVFIIPSSLTSPAMSGTGTEHYEDNVLTG